MASPAISPTLTALPIIAISLLLLLLRHSSAAAAAPVAQGCVSELVMFSPCLSFVSAPPNNLSDTADSECCAAFSDTISDDDGGGGSCLCLLLREPRMLGFPINQTRLLALPSACRLGESSFEDVCSDSEAMPPDEADSRISSPPDSAPSGQPSSSESLPPESDDSDAASSSPTGSMDTSTEQSPQPEIVPRLTLPTPPRSPQASSSDPTIRFYIRKCWLQLAILMGFSSQLHSTMEMS